MRVFLLFLAWVLLTGVLIAAGVGVIHSSSINEFDHHVTSIVVTHRTPALDSAMKIVTWLGSWVAFASMGILLIVLIVIRRLPVAVGLMAVVAWAGESSSVFVAKHVVRRSRPPPDLRLVSAHGWSWPSGHTAVAVVVFATLALVVSGLGSSAAYRTLPWVLAAVAIVAVGYSRIELAVHWSTDVIASMIFVVAWLIVVLVLLTPRRESRHDRNPQ
jgi:membrane-associated phospholipid phosphatase